MKNLPLLFCLLLVHYFAVSQNIYPLDKGLQSRGYPYTISQDASGRVYIGGYLKGIGGLETRSIAQLDNGVWKKLAGDPDAIWKTTTMGNDLYAVGLYATTNGGVLHWDGAQWDTLGAGLVGGTYVSSLEWAAGYLWLSTGNGILLRWNNSFWDTISLPADIKPYGLKSLGDTLFAWGNATSNGSYALTYFSDGEWTILPQTNNYETIYDVERWQQQIFMAKGRRVFKWNGNSWDEFYTIDSPGEIQFLTGIQENLFVCTRSFNTYRIEQLDANASSTLIGSIENAPLGVRVAASINGELWIGGDFSYIDDKFVGGLARFTGTEWISPGYAIGNQGGAYGFCLYKDTLAGDLYVGGGFDYAGTLYAANIARWDGDQWHAMGTGLNNRVRKIFRYQGQLYAAGSFTESGGQPCPYLARWTGSNWQAVLPALDGAVRDVIEWNGKLYVAGEFDHPFPGLMTFDGSNWAAPFNSGGEAVYSLTLFNGNLIAGRSGSVAEINTGGNVSVIGNFFSIVLDVTEHAGDLYAAVNSGTDNGVYQYGGNGQWTNLNLPLESAQTPWRVFSVQGNLLVMADGKGMFRFDNGQWQFLESWRITDVLPNGPGRYYVASFPTNIYQHSQLYKEINGIGEMVFEAPEVSVTRTGDSAICPRRYIFWDPVTEGVFMNYRWSFPGANIDSSNRRLPINQYPQNGIYPAFLIAENLAGADTIAIQPVVVQDDCTVPPGPKPDNVWLLGSHFLEERPMPALDFYYNRPDSAGFYTPFEIATTNAGICDDDGNLLLYTNGLMAVNSRHKIIEGSEDFNKEGIYADSDYETLYDNQGALILPFPEHPGQFYIFHMAVSEFAITMDTGARLYRQPLRLAYSIVDMNAHSGQGQMTVKAQTAVNDTLLEGTLQAVRHGNGRDWWLVVHAFNSDCFYVLLLSPTGVTSAGTQPAGFHIFNGTQGQTVFSPDGNWLGMTDNLSDTAYIWKFDRCLGIFEPETILSFGPSQQWNGIGTGCSFSPSGRFFYAGNNRYLYQFDLEATEIADTKQLVGQWDGKGAPYVGNYFSKHLNAPDGKIYMSFYDGFNQHLNAIHLPDEAGAACLFQNRAVSLSERSQASLPNYPNLRLGAVPDLPCSERPSGIAETTWKVSPNPGNGQFTITPEPSLNNTEAFLVELFNLAGQLEHTEHRRFIWEQTFDFSNARPGMYLLRISGNGDYQTLKLIIAP
ncbi:MAG: hypothetical protein EPGJADBJ_05225 [Saprospiraceae bacterium]|nr:hypothetical protein [Saprospiraceae bacterium]